MAVVYYPKQSIVLKRNTISASFEQVVLNTTPNTILYFGSGSISEISGSTIYITSSHAHTASYLLGFIESASFSILALSASYAPVSPSVSASYALSASYVLNGGTGNETILTTGSFYPITSSWAVSSSWAPSSQAAESVSASWASSSLSSSFALTSSYSVFVYYNVTQSLTLINSASWTSSSLSSSYLIPGTYRITSSWAQNAIISNTSLYSSQSQWGVSSSYASSSTTAGTATNLGLTAYNISVNYASQSNLATSSSFASSSLQVRVITSTNDVYYYPAYVVATAGVNSIFADSDFRFNPVANSISGSNLNITASLLGNVIGTASYALQTLSASYALNVGGSGGTTLVTGAYYPITSSWSDTSLYTPSASKSDVSDFALVSANTLYSSSYALSSSYAPGGNNGVISGDSYNITTSFSSGSITSSYLIPGTYRITSSWSGNSNVSNTTLYASQSNLATSSSFASSSLQVRVITSTNDVYYYPAYVVATAGVNSIFADSDFRFNPVANSISGSNLNITASLLGNVIGTASYALQTLSASYAPGSPSVSSSYALSSSYAPGGNNGVISGDSYNISVSWASSSITSSYLPPGTYQMTASWAVNLSAHTSSWAGNAIVSNTSLYASQSSWAVSASYASSSLSASYAPGSLTSSYFNVVSASGAWKQYVDFSSGNLIFLYS